MNGNNEVQYVYKYVDNCGDVAYVGITNNLHKRVVQHTHDKLQDIKDPTIYYFPVRYRGDAEMLETYLIDHYRTGKRYNVSKTKKGNFSFLDICEELPWKRFTGTVDKHTTPFQVSQVKKEVVIEKETVVEKKVYVKDTSSTEAKIRMIDQMWRDNIEFFGKEIQFEIDILEALNEWLGQYPDNARLKRGIKLHEERLSALREANDLCCWDMNMTPEKQKALKRCKEANDKIVAFENEINEDKQ